jgi:hypothetical protein
MGLANMAILIFLTAFVPLWLWKKKLPQKTRK